MKNTIKKSARIFAFVICFVLTLTLFTSCSKEENTTVNMAVFNTTDSNSLQITGLIKNYFSGTYPCIYFADKIEDSVEKLEKEKIQNACVIAYMSPGQYKEAIKEKSENYRIILIDNYNEDGSVNGMWVARADWLEQCPSVYKKTVKGFLRSMNYRNENMKMSFEEAKLSVKDIGDSDYDFEKNQKDVMQFLAVYTKDNGDGSAMEKWAPLQENKIVTISGTEMKARYNGFENGSGEGYEECKALYESIFAVPATEESLKKTFDFKGVAEIKEEDLVEKAEAVEEKEMPAIVIVLAIVLVAAAAAGVAFTLVITVKKAIIESKEYKKEKRK